MLNRFARGSKSSDDFFLAKNRYFQDGRQIVMFRVIYMATLHIYEISKVYMVVSDPNICLDNIKLEISIYTTAKLQNGRQIRHKI